VLNTAYTGWDSNSPFYTVSQTQDCALLSRQTADLTLNTCPPLKVIEKAIEYWRSIKGLFRIVSQTVVRRKLRKEKHCKKRNRHLTNEKYTHTCVLKRPLLADLQQKVGELVLSITSCPSIITLENTLHLRIEKMLW
jgi:hypothetical protein